ncbi:MAG: hypothetical protein HUJ65_03870 [Oscillospiraceae bacterium]|nr:hypothetical protein [Oscillospiraceae bacterium]
MGAHDNLYVYNYKPGYPEEKRKNPGQHKILWMDETTMPGAPYMELVWYYEPFDLGPNSHYHEYDEFLGFIGSDYEHPEELNATVRVTLEGEDTIVTKSCMVYIPAGMKHSVFAIEKLDRPILHFSGGPNQVSEKLGNSLDEPTG